MFKRFGLWILINMAVMITISIIMRVLGVGNYITQYGIDYQQLMIFCLIWGMVGSFISLALSKQMAKWGMRLEMVDETSHYRSLYLKVKHLAQAAGLSKMPEVAIYQSAEMNAFATGPSRNNSLVAVSTGLLNSMSDDEVEAVLAHEVGHIANGDMVTMALLQGVINAFVLFFAKVITFAIDNALRDDNGRGGLGMFARIGVEIALQIFFSFLGMFVLAGFSRFREYRADQAAAKLAGRDKMIAALKKLQRQMEYIVGQKQRQMAEGEERIAAFKISNRPGWMALLSTHPKLEDRIRALEMMR